jgi:hypothetical protein
VPSRGPHTRTDWESTPKPSGVDRRRGGSGGGGDKIGTICVLILLFVVIGKSRDQGLLEIPSIIGFVTYQLASLGQGLREIDD